MSEKSLLLAHCSVPAIVVRGSLNILPNDK